MKRYSTLINEQVAAARAEGLEVEIKQYSHNFYHVFFEGEELGRGDSGKATYDLLKTLRNVQEIVRRHAERAAQYGNVITINTH